MPPPPIPTPIHHITHCNNLTSIVSAGGLLCCNLIRERSIRYRNIAYGSIQDRRARTPVPCGPRGNLHDYVPFYFGPRSPMLYTISRGNVPGYEEGQRPVVHLVSSAQLVYANGPAVFTNGHAIMTLSDFFDDLARLDRIDWPLISARYWFDTQEDGDRCRRRQAEFLVYRRVPWELITQIGVLDRTIRARVESVLRDAPHQPPVVVQKAWYYS